MIDPGEVRAIVRCFNTDGIVLDLTPMNDVSVQNGMAVISAGVRLKEIKAHHDPTGLLRFPQSPGPSRRSAPAHRR